MVIKNLFNNLKQIGKKKYYSRNGEEELYFFNKTLEIEIFNINGNIDLVINCNGVRNNYLKSESLSSVQKEQIKSILNSYTSLDIKCKELEKILLEIFA